MPVWLLVEYLKEIGGQPDDFGGYCGEGWSATIEKMENFTIGSLSVGQVRLIFKGESGAVRSNIANVRRKNDACRGIRKPACGITMPVYFWM